MIELDRNYKRRICPAYEVGKSGGCRRFYIDIEISKEGNLSLCGIWHNQGQIYEDLTHKNLIPAKEFKYADILKIQNIWKRWHLNHMRAGTPRQEEFIKNWLIVNKFDYKEACRALDEIELLYDNGYKYGSAWLKEEVPDDVVFYLFSLPAISGDSWSDVQTPEFDETEWLRILSQNGG